MGDGWRGPERREGGRRKRREEGEDEEGGINRVRRGRETEKKMQKDAEVRISGEGERQRDRDREIETETDRTRQQVTQMWRKRDSEDKVFKTGSEKKYTPPPLFLFGPYWVAKMGKDC